MSKIARDPAEVHEAWRMQKRMLEAGYELFPLKRYDAVLPPSKAGGKPSPGGKTPRDKGWKAADYSKFDFKNWMMEGGNVGVRLLPNQLVLDVDPRNGGLESMLALLWDVPELEDTLALGGPRVLSGREDGGRHYYLKKPPEVNTRITFNHLPGLDFKRGPGNLVVAPGSLHQVTKKMYRLTGDWSAVPEAPPALIEMLARQAVQRTQGNGGEVSLQEFAKMLDVIPATDFGQGGEFHDEWLTMMFACFAATNGDGCDIWLDWCATDPQYGPEASELNRARWWSSTAVVKGGSTFRTLLRHVSRVGRKDLVRKVGEWDDSELEDTERDDGLWG